MIKLFLMGAGCPVLHGKESIIISRKMDQHQSWFRKQEIVTGLSPTHSVSNYRYTTFRWYIIILKHCYLD
jgi:hypothetical protein